MGGSGLVPGPSLVRRVKCIVNNGGVEAEEALSSPTSSLSDPFQQLMGGRGVDPGGPKTSDSPMGPGSWVLGTAQTPQGAGFPRRAGVGSHPREDEATV